MKYLEYAKLMTEGPLFNRSFELKRKIYILHKPISEKPLSIIDVDEKLALKNNFTLT